MIIRYLGRAAAIASLGLLANAALAASSDMALSDDDRTFSREPAKGGPTTSNAAIRSFVSETLPTLRKHLQMMENLEAGHPDGAAHP